MKTASNILIRLMCDAHIDLRNCQDKELKDDLVQWVNDNSHRKGDEEMEEQLRRALKLACERIADSDQSYEEANTADGWMEVFLEQAKSE